MAALLPILLLIVLMYFMLIRPQQKRMRAQQSLLSAVQEGDEVLTTAGVYGFITAMDGDVVWVEIAEGVEVRVAKGAIARRVDRSRPTAAERPPTAAAASSTPRRSSPMATTRRSPPTTSS